MLRNDKKAESARIRANADHSQMTFRWPSTIAALLMLSLIIYGLVSGAGRDFRSVVTFLLPGLCFTLSAIWGWHVYNRNKRTSKEILSGK